MAIGREEVGGALDGRGIIQVDDQLALTTTAKPPLIRLD